jgi:alpha-1,3-rhamnosyl/mannosyltransferase
MAAGVPVVATTAGSVPEVVGDAALLVDPDDVDALSDALETAITDETVRERLVTRGHEQRSAFSWARMVDELLGVYAAVRA